MDPSSLLRAEQSGRCSFYVDRTVNVAKVRRQLARNTDISKPKAKGNGAAGALPIGIAESRAERASYEAKLSRLEYEREAGLLISKEAVERAVFDKVRRTRDHVLAIPDRVDALLAAESDAQRCNAILAEELEKALAELAGSVTS